MVWGHEGQSSYNEMTHIQAFKTAKKFWYKDKCRHQKSKGVNTPLIAKSSPGAGTLNWARIPGGPGGPTAIHYGKIKKVNNMYNKVKGLPRGLGEPTNTAPNTRVL